MVEHMHQRPTWNHGAMVSFGLNVDILLLESGAFCKGILFSPYVISWHHKKNHFAFCEGCSQLCFFGSRILFFREFTLTGS